ncbi:MAG: hypothetical protein ACTSRS_09575 [Candidatus Helarchaeota archaeon]
MGFFGDLVNRPEKAIETMEEKRNIWKSIVLFIAVGALLLWNYFFMHFKGGFPAAFIVGAILSGIGIIVEFGFVLGFIVDLYIVLKIVKYEPAGDTCKTASWCILIPSLIYCLGLTGLHCLFETTSTTEFAPYTYDTLKFLLYIWIIGLLVVNVTRSDSEHKIRNMLIVIGCFAFNWIVWTALTADLFTELYTAFI